MHSIHHELQSRIDDGTGVFWIEAFNQRRGAFEVSKQRGDGLALAIDRPTGSIAACSARMRSARCLGV